MFKTLRRRLLFAFAIVIIAVLLIVSFVLLAAAAQPNIRYAQALQLLRAANLGSRAELIRLRREGDLLPSIIEGALSQTAVETGVRIAAVDNETQRVIYDSNESNSWLKQSVPELENLPSNLLTSADEDALLGRFTDGNNNPWLVYSPPSDVIPRIRLVYALPEPTPLGFFVELFLTPLCGAGILAFFLAILLAAWIARSMTKPLREMAVAADAIAQGDYDQRLELRGTDEVKRVAANLNRMATAVQATQLAQRDFVTNVSHDLKTPITAVQGWSQALLDGTAVTAEEQHRAARTIYNESGRMARLVDQLLDLARLESGQITLKLEPVPMDQLLEDLRRSFNPQAQAQEIHLTIETVPAPPVYGDKDRLTQIFGNLIENAFAHTAGGGRIHLAMRRHGEKALEITVQDTGAGIPPDELPRIFERFYQVDKSRTRADGRAGSGLGLAIVWELVEAHNGRALARSRVEEGSLFVVRLPFINEPQAATLISERKIIDN